MERIIYFQHQLMFLIPTLRVVRQPVLLCSAYIVLHCIALLQTDVLHKCDMPEDQYVAD